MSISDTTIHRPENIHAMTDNRVFNTGETQQQLREKYNPDGSPLRKAQMRMLDMLDYIDTVCREQGIAYRLDSGNVIGAVRHGGFIPWDDDIDIALSMSEYKRLCRYLHDNHTVAENRPQLPISVEQTARHENGICHGLSSRKQGCKGV